MKIERKYPPTIPFKEINIGDTFSLIGLESVYIKTEPLHGDNKAFISAINLRNGLGVHFDDIDEIIRVKGTFVEE